MKKIVLLVDSLGFGGAQRQIVNLAVELKKQGDDVVLMRYRKDDFYLPLLAVAGIKPITVSAKNALQKMWRIRKAIRSFSPDAVISFMSASNTYAAFASVGRHKWKLLISERIANEKSFAGIKSKFLKRFQGKHADKIVCNSKAAEKLWRDHFPKYAAKLDTIYNVIDVLPEKTGFSSDGKCRVLVAARYEAGKNVSGLIQSVSKLEKSERARLEIHWYGKANVVKGERSELDKGSELVKALGLSDCVFLHAATSEIYPLIAKADFIGLFSFLEGLPNSIIEGMSYKKPVIMSRVSDYDVLVDEKNGVLCDPNDPDSIAQALMKAVNTTAEGRIAMGERSYEKIRQLCSREAIMQKWNEILRA